MGECKTWLGFPQSVPSQSSRTVAAMAAVLYVLTYLLCSLPVLGALLEYAPALILVDSLIRVVGQGAFSPLYLGGVELTKRVPAVGQFLGSNAHSEPGTKKQVAAAVAVVLGLLGFLLYNVSFAVGGFFYGIHAVIAAAEAGVGLCLVSLAYDKGVSMGHIPREWCNTP